MNENMCLAEFAKAIIDRSANTNEEDLIKYAQKLGRAFKACIDETTRHFPQKDNS